MLFINQSAVDQKKKTREIVKKHKDALIASLDPKQKAQLRGLFAKFYRDYKDVASKRGSKNFDLEKWLKNNIQ